MRAPRIRNQQAANKSASADAARSSWLVAFGAAHQALVDPERQLLSESAIAIDADIATTGYKLAVIEHMPDFAAILGEVGKFVPNAFSAEAKPAPHGEAIGLVMYNPAGEVVATHGMRLYHLGCRSLADHLATLSLFYDRPIEQMIPGEYLWLEDAARRYAETVDGQATWSGGLWVRPDHRSQFGNLSTFLVFASRVLTSWRWGRTVVFSITGDIWAKPNAAARIKRPDVYERVKWWRPNLSEAERNTANCMLLVVTEPDIPFSRAAAFLEGQDRLWIGAPTPVAARRDFGR